MEEFNQVVDDLKSWYGEDVLEVIKVDGNIGRDISAKYNV